jgi:hypothetical protein
VSFVENVSGSKSKLEKERKEQKKERTNERKEKS